MKRTIFNIRASGTEACFTNPAFTAERFSYDVPTPVALEGTLKAIFWRRGLRWNIHRICVLSAIKRTTIRRNEVLKLGPISDRTDGNFTQRLTSLLKDVDYSIQASLGLEGDGDPALVVKGNAMFERYMNQGKQFHQPYFGCREWIADVRWATPNDPKPIDDTRVLGRMVFGYVWEGDRRAKILEYDTVMKRGVIDVPSYESVVAAHNELAKAIKAAS
jgi:CRISPR-associated protein Cas5d